jgi:hypothetical protein
VNLCKTLISLKCGEFLFSRVTIGLSSRTNLIFLCLFIFFEIFCQHGRYIHCLWFILLVSTGKGMKNMNDFSCNVRVLFNLVLHNVFWLLKGVKNAAVHMSMAALSIEYSPSVTNLSLQGHGPLYQPLIWQLTELEHHLMDHQVSEFSKILIQLLKILFTVKCLFILPFSALFTVTNTVTIE